MCLWGAAWVRSGISFKGVTGSIPHVFSQRLRCDVHTPSSARFLRSPSSLACRYVLGLLRYVSLPRVGRVRKGAAESLASSEAPTIFLSQSSRCQPSDERRRLVCDQHGQSIALLLATNLKRDWMGSMVW